MAEKKPVRVLVVVKRHWTKNMGMSSLFQSTTPGHEEGVEFHIIPVSRYDLSDSYFVEIEYYPRVLADKWARVFIPKEQVVSIVQLESSEDLGKIGY